MTSLCPGPVFTAPGFNQNSTPTPPTATPADIDRKLRRQPFSDGEWPRDSPVSRVYDLQNTSTSLVLLNNRNKRTSQLRGLTSRNGNIIAPDPERHALPEESPMKVHHQKCFSSSSEPYQPKVKLNLGWINATQRPSLRFDTGSPVNPHRHTSCRVSSRRPISCWSGIMSQRPHTSTPYSARSELQSMTPFLSDPDLPKGAQKYLYKLARIYSTSQMKQLKQAQYHYLFFKEFAKGYHSMKEYEQYFNYLNAPRKTQIGRLDNYEEICRSRSAPPPSSLSIKKADSEKIESRQQKQGQSIQSWAPSSCSRVSSASIPFFYSSHQGSKKRTASRQHMTMSTPKELSKEPEPGTTHYSDADLNLKASGSQNGQSDRAAKEEGTSELINKDESERPEETLTKQENIEELEQQEAASPNKAEESQEDFLSSEDKDITVPQGEDVISSRSDFHSPSLGKETGIPRTRTESSQRREDETDKIKSAEEEEQIIEVPATVNDPQTSSNTSNSILALIIDAAEKEDTKSLVNRDKEKQISQEAALPHNVRESDTEQASDNSSRISKEDGSRPMSRGGQSPQFRAQEDAATESYPDQSEEKLRQSDLAPELSTVDINKPAISKTKEQEEIQELNSTASMTKSSRSSIRRNDSAHSNCKSEEQADIPSPGHSDQLSIQNDDMQDISAESRNRDIQKIEY